jgi:hypothetical protein
MWRLRSLDGDETLINRIEAYLCNFSAVWERDRVLVPGISVMTWMTLFVPPLHINVIET